MATIKNVTIPIDAEYLNEVARERGVSRTRLVKVVMDCVIERRMVGEIIGPGPIASPATARYRRFPPRG